MHPRRGKGATLPRTQTQEEKKRKRKGNAHLCTHNYRPRWARSRRRPSAALSLSSRGGVCARSVACLGARGGGVGARGGVCAGVRGGLCVGARGGLCVGARGGLCMGARGGLCVGACGFRACGFRAWGECEGLKRPRDGALPPLLRAEARGARGADGAEGADGARKGDHAAPYA